MNDKKWPGGIVYYMLDKKYNHIQKRAIRKAFKKIEKHTCIKFKEKPRKDKKK